MSIQLKRAYAKPDRADGLRILVERLWPRGLPKEKAKIDLWAKDIAPSADLRRWYGHDPEKWPEFQRRYRAELRGNKVGLTDLKSRIRGKTATFIFAAHDEERNSAVVLKDVIEGRRAARA
jgi:uncharacterized protein YeaO (DUF488 family)